MKKMTDDMIKSFDTTYKIGMLATIDDEGSPHLTMLSSLQAGSPGQLVMGQFTKGLSKDNIRKRPEVGFLIMSLDKKFWTGTARWTHSRTEGPEYEMYNRKPLFRYNTYFGVHTVHYFDLVDISEGQPLRMGAIVPRAILNLAARQFMKQQGNRVMKPWAERLMKGIQTLKFISWVQEDGYPAVLPVIEAQAADSATLSIPAGPYAKQAAGLKPGAAVAVNGMNPEMVGTLVKGSFEGFKPTILGRMGKLNIQRVYNSLPPKPGYIYP